MYKSVFALLLLMGSTTFAQELSGRIIDAESQQGIPGAKVWIRSVGAGVKTDSEGGFRIDFSLPENFQLIVSAEFFKSKVLEVKRGDEINVTLDPSHLDMEDVIVSSPGGATRQENVFKVDRLKLNDLNAIQSSNLTEAISNINGVQSASTGVGISKPVIRGLQGIRVLTLLNGVRLDNQQWGGDHGMAVTQLGVSSVEVIKGPSSLLYGSDAFGGVIYLVDAPYPAQGDIEVNAQTRFESVNMGTSTSLQLGMANKGFKMNLSGLFSNSADYQLPNGKYLDNSRFGEQGGKLALGYSNKNWVSHLRYTYSHARAGIPGHSHDSIPDPISFQKDQQERERRIPVQLTTNHLLSWENKWFKGKSIYSLTIANTLNRLTEFEDKQTIPGLDMVLNNTILNARLQRNISEKVKWYSGFQGVNQLNRNIDGASDTLIPSYDLFDIGVYSLIYAKLGKYDVQAGLRADARHLNVADFEFSRTYFSPNFSLGAVRNWEQNLLRLNVSSGYRAPHVSEMLSDGQHHGSLRYEKGETELDPEYSIQFDFSYEHESEHLSIVINPFYNYLLNYISLNPQDSLVNGLPLYKYEQANSGQLYGIDLGLHYHPHFAHFVHLETSYSYVRANDANGRAFSLIPQARINTFLKFDLDMKGAVKIDDIVLQHQYFFDQNLVAPLEETSPSYHLINLGVNASIGEKEQFLIGLGVKNILNTEYINHLSRLKNINTPHPGRNFYVSVKYQLSKSKF